MLTTTGSPAIWVGKVSIFTARAVVFPPNPCPPIVVGVGIGGTVDKCAQIAKKALFRDIGEHNKDENIKNLERILLDIA